MNKSFKKILSITLAFIMLFTVSSISSFAVDKIYEISTAEELETFLKSEDDFEGVTVILKNDIVVNDGIFSLDENNTPLYNGVDFKKKNDVPYSLTGKDVFKGTFDGQGHTLSGLYLGYGLFEECIDATVKNLNITNSLVEMTSYYCGAVCGTADNSIFENCYVDAFVIADGDVDAGGMIGEAINCTITACRNENSVISSSCAGGLIGYAEGCEISYCYNKGNVYAKKVAGGIADCLLDCNVTYCYNVGDIEAVTTEYRGHAGGLAGEIEISEGYKIMHSYSGGSITGTYIGKLSSYFSGDIFSIICFYFEGESVAEADNSGGILSEYEDYRRVWDYMNNPGNGYITADRIPKSLYIYNVSSLKEDWCPSYVGGKAFVGDFDGSNKGYPQLAMFHNHIWGKYSENDDGTESASCAFVNCDATDTRENTQKFSISGSVTSFGDEWWENVYISLSDADGNIIYDSAEIEIDVNEFAFTALNAGEYVMTVSKKGHVTRKYEISITDESLQIDVKIHISGDVNGDGKVTVADYAKVLKHTKKTETLSDYEFDCADVTADGRVTVADYAKILKHVKKTDTV